MNDNLPPDVAEMVERLRDEAVSMLATGYENVGLDTIDLLREAAALLARLGQKQEPIAWMCQMFADSSKVYFFATDPDLRDNSPWDRITPLYALPPAP